MGFQQQDALVIDDKEVIIYTGKSGNTLTGITRGINGTKAIAHADDASVKASVVGTLNGALLADTNGTGGSGTSITLTDATAFPSSGSIDVSSVNGSETITYTGKSGNNLTTITRGASGTSAVAHADGSSLEGSSIVLTDATSFPSSGSIVVDEKEVISYTGKTTNTLTGISSWSRGHSATTV